MYFVFCPFSIKYDTNVKQNYCRIMPVIDKNNFNSIYNVVSKKLTTENGKRSRKIEIRSNTLTSNTSKKAKESSIPVNEIFDRKEVPSKKTSVTLKNLSISNNSITGNVEGKLVENSSSSIVSSSQKLKDLQELHRELNKSSYEPPKPFGMDFKPRKSTMEAIRTAIEKAKQKMDISPSKSVGTDDNRAMVITSEASTSTNRSKIKKKKKKKQITNNSSDAEKKTTKKKKTLDVKVKTKIAVVKKDD